LTHAVSSAMCGRMSRSNDQTTREQILRAATLELAGRGWGGLRTRAVAERAGVNKGLVHYHFGSMDNLRFEVIALAMAEAVDESAAAVLSAPTLAGGVGEFCRHLSLFGADSPQGAHRGDAARATRAPAQGHDAPRRRGV